MKKLIPLLLIGAIAAPMQAQIVKKNPPKTEKSTQPAPSTGINRIKKMPVPYANDPFQLGHVDYKPLTSPVVRENAPKVRTIRAKNGMPIFFEGKTSASTTLTESDNIGNKALEYTASLLPAGLNNPIAEFEVSKINTDKKGNKHVRLQQVWNGIPVYGGEVIAHTRSEAFGMLNGRYFPTPELSSASPALSKEQCKTIVGQAYGIEKVKQEWSDHDLMLIGGSPFEAELVVYHVKNQLHGERLCWKVDFFPNVMKRMVYFIDAESGEVLNSYDHTCSFVHKHGHEEPGGTAPPPVVGNGLDLFNINRSFGAWREGSTYFLEDAARPMFNASASNMPGSPVGAIVTLDAQNRGSGNPSFNPIFVTSGSATFNNKTAVSAHYNGGTSYEYYLNTFGRNSINGQGGNIISIINVTENNGSSMGNAYWNGAAMFYGNGDSFFKELARGLDVAGHEMTHGVIERTANLIYQDEPGALNESFADVFGAMIDRDDWLIGEDVMESGVTPTNALRSMSDPHNGYPAPYNVNNSFQQPKNVNEQFTGSFDNGGVHINSGIPNYAYYLFATNPNVGRDIAEQVYYKALNDYLVKSSQFIDCRIAVIQAALDDYGQQVAQAAADAFTAVGILGDDPGGNYLGELSPNPGTDLILVVSNDFQNLDLANGNGQVLGTLYNQGVSSKPSVNDNGTQIVFVDEAGNIVYVELNYNMGTVTPTVGIISDAPEWRNAAISKDPFGRYVAGIKKTREPYVYIDDYLGQVFGQPFRLYNPTTSQGGQLSNNVNYPDVLEFDYSGEFLMYDANNRLTNDQGVELDYWDIGLLQFSENGSFAPDPENAFITKLFSVLPENASVADPTFAKNAPFVIGFDFYDGNEDRFDILAGNTETGDVGEIRRDNGSLGYPSYSRLDDRIIYEGPNANDDFNIYIQSLNGDKISSQNNESLFVGDRNWGNWFSNGDRSLMVNTNSIEDNSFGLRAFPNPAVDNLSIAFSMQEAAEVQVNIFDQLGRNVLTEFHRAAAGENLFELNLNGMPAGTYTLRLSSGNTVTTLQVAKY